MREPVALSVAIGGLLSTGVALVAVFWPDRLTPEAQIAIIAFGNAAILTVAALLARANVTPTASPMLSVGTPVLVAGTSDSPPPDAVVALRSQLKGAQPVP